MRPKCPVICVEESKSKSSNFFLLFREIRTELQRIILKYPLRHLFFRWILIKDRLSRSLANGSRETVHNAELFVVCHVNCMAPIMCLEPLCTIQYPSTKKDKGWGEILLLQLK